jgi:hypothetical protein
METFQPKQRTEVETGARIELFESGVLGRGFLKCIPSPSGLRASGKKLNFSDSPKIDCA